MATIAQALAAGLKHLQAGELQRAEWIYQEILRLDSRNADALHLLGLVAHRLEKHSVAIDYISRAIALKPDVAGFHVNIGAAYGAAGKLEKSVASYCRALEIKPDCAEAHINLGNVLWDQGKRDEAAASYRRALEIKPNCAAEYRQLGHLLWRQGKLDDAVVIFQRALQIQPDDAAAQYGLGNAFCSQGKIDQARVHYRRALEINPDNADAHNRLGNVLCSQGKLEEAVACYGRALEVEPGCTKAHNNLGNALKEQGKLDEALDCYAAALNIAPADLSLKLNRALALPLIPGSNEQIRQTRAQLAREINTLLDEPCHFEDLSRIEAVSSHFYLAYHGLDDRRLQSKIAAVQAKIFPSLQYTAAHCLGPGCHETRDRPIRVGFLSTFFFDHTIGKLTGGLIKELDRDRFETVVLTVPGPADKWRRFIEAGANATVVLPRDITVAREQIAERKLDVLFYADIGMDPFTYYLAFARLAPVQCVTWGHPVTTGVPTIDYFISNQDLEPDDGTTHYVEELVPLKYLPTYYYKPEIPKQPKGRVELGLHGERNIYLCPQSLFKLHPEFDALLGAILQRDGNADVVLIEGKHPHWRRQLTERFLRTIPSVVDRVRFLPRVSREDFVQLVAASDVVLDTIRFGGGNTVYEAMSVGTPIVTWPGSFMRARVSYACYRQMGLSQCVASNTEQYVELAVCLGTDKQRRSEVASRILAANGVLYENANAVRELERFFIQAVHQARLRSAK